MSAKREAKVVALMVLSMGGTALIGATIFKYCLPSYYFSAFPYIPLFFTILGITTLYIEKKEINDNKRFYQAFMLTKGVKLFATILICFIYAFFEKENAIPFLISFFVFYVVYTIFEALVSLKLNKDLQNETIQEQ